MTEGTATQMPPPFRNVLDEILRAPEFQPRSHHDSHIARLLHWAFERVSAFLHWLDERLPETQAPPWLQDTGVRILEALVLSAAIVALASLVMKLSKLARGTGSPFRREAILASPAPATKQTDEELSPLSHYLSRAELFLRLQALRSAVRTLCIERSAAAKSATDRELLARGSNWTDLDTAAASILGAYEKAAYAGEAPDPHTIENLTESFARLKRRA